MIIAMTLDPFFKSLPFKLLMDWKKRLFPSISFNFSSSMHWRNTEENGSAVMIFYFKKYTKNE